MNRSPFSIQVHIIHSLLQLVTKVFNNILNLSLSKSFEIALLHSGEYRISRYYEYDDRALKQACPET